MTTLLAWDGLIKEKVYDILIMISLSVPTLALLMSGDELQLFIFKKIHVHNKSGLERHASRPQRPKPAMCVPHCAVQDASMCLMCN